MNEPTLDTLAQRLDRLERENRWWKRIGAVVLAGLAAVILMGQATLRKVPRVVEAEKFVLRDGSGNARAMLEVLSNGAAGLGFFDTGGKRRGVMAVEADGTAGLSLRDNDGKTRVALGVTPDGSPALFLQDKDGTVRAMLAMVGNGAVRLALGDKDLKGPAALLALTVSDGKTGLSIHGKDGKVVWKAP